MQFVDVKRACPYGAVCAKFGEHELTTTYFVIIGKKVAGFYLQINPAPNHSVFGGGTIPVRRQLGRNGKISRSDVSEKVGACRQNKRRL